MVEAGSALATACLSVTQRLRVVAVEHLTVSGRLERGGGRDRCSRSHAPSRTSPARQLAAWPRGAPRRGDAAAAGRVAREPLNTPAAAAAAAPDDHGDRRAARRTRRAAAACAVGAARDGGTELGVQVVVGSRGRGPRGAAADRTRRRDLSASAACGFGHRVPARRSRARRPVGSGTCRCSGRRSPSADSSCAHERVRGCGTLRGSFARPAASTASTAGGIMRLRSDAAGGACLDVLTSLRAEVRRDETDARRRATRTRRRRAHTGPMRWSPRGRAPARATGRRRCRTVGRASVIVSSLVSRAIPKSATCSTRLRSSRKFAGLMSRWTIPAAWA